MLLVRCTHVENIIEQGIPCIALRACLLRFRQDTGREASDADFQAVVWHNQPVEELQSLPSKDKNIGLFAYPGASTLTLISNDWKYYCIWDGPVLFIFLIYETELVPSELIDAIFSIKEV